MTQIRQEGFHNSKVMEIEGQLTDVIGPRLTGSPAMKRANDWTREQFTEWGLANSHLESFNFGRGWANDYTQVRMVAPENAQIIAYPKAWTVSTNGVLRAPVVKAKLATKEDLDKYKGQLAGKIVLNGEMREVKPQSEAALQRYDDKKLAEIAQYDIPSEKPRFSREETPSASPSRRRSTSSSWMSMLLPSSILAVPVKPASSSCRAELATSPILLPAFRRWSWPSRAMDASRACSTATFPSGLEMDIRNQFYDSDLNAYNTVAEIPGTDKSGEIVMLGAHLDSWHGGTGATDNAAGSAITMEAIRILKAIGVKPRRTIRIALWSGEEEGLLGSVAYVKEHFGSRADPTDPKELSMPAFLRKDDTPLNLKPEQAKVSAYFNIDNGTGKIRGVYLQENQAVEPIFSDVDATLQRPRHVDAHHAQHGQHRPCFVRRRRYPRLSVHPGPGRVHDAHPPLESGRLRTHPTRRYDAGRGDPRGIRLRRRHARHHAAAETAAETRARDAPGAVEELE